MTEEKEAFALKKKTLQNPSLLSFSLAGSAKKDFSIRFPLKVERPLKFYDKT